MLIDDIKTVVCQTFALPQVRVKFEDGLKCED